MSIELSSLSKDDIGKWVMYDSGHKSEKGRIKSWNDKYVFVVYHCGDDWDGWQNYTGVATRPEDLTFKENQNEKLVHFQDEQSNQ